MTDSFKNNKYVLFNREYELDTSTKYRACDQDHREKLREADDDIKLGWG
jgi:hypothetical protein